MKYVELFPYTFKVNYIHDENPGFSSFVPVIETKRTDITPGMYYLDGDFREAPPNEYYYWSDGAWVFDTDKAVGAIREERNKRLTATDWMVLPDSPYNTETVRAYRQALRDLPQQEGFPWNGPDDPDVPWPTLNEEV
jgi:hypothetical protein